MITKPLPISQPVESGEGHTLYRATFVVDAADRRTLPDLRNGRVILTLHEEADNRRRPPWIHISVKIVVKCPKRNTFQPVSMQYAKARVSITTAYPKVSH
jgi:hypothetical protein